MTKRIYVNLECFEGRILAPMDVTREEWEFLKRMEENIDSTDGEGCAPSFSIFVQGVEADECKSCNTPERMSMLQDGKCMNCRLKEDDEHESV